MGSPISGLSLSHPRFLKSVFPRGDGQAHLPFRESKLYVASSSTWQSCTTARSKEAVLASYRFQFIQTLSRREPNSLSHRVGFSLRLDEV